MIRSLFRLAIVMLGILIVGTSFALPATAQSTLVEYESNATANMNGLVYGPYWTAQTFTPSETHVVKKVELPFLRLGNPLGDIVVSIRATDAEGRPVGQDLAAGKIPAGSVDQWWAPATWYEFDLGEGCVVEGGETYAIVWRAPEATEANPLYYWSQIDGTYSGGRLMTGTGGKGWRDVSTQDGAFRELGSASAAPASSSAPSAEPTPATPAPTPTATPEPTPAGGGPASEIRNIGYASIYAVANGVLDRIPWEQFTHLIWQNVWVNSGSDPTLRVQDGYPWSQIAEVGKACHANGVEALACLFGTSDLVSITSSPSKRAQLVANLTDLVNKYNLDGINIDWEGGADPNIYAQFIRELRDSMGPDKTITAIGTWLGPPVNIASSAAPYLDFVTVMTYDYWHVPSGGSLDVVSKTMNMWADAGFPKDKLVMGIPFFGTTGAGTTGWTPYSTIVDRVNPAPGQNSGGGYHWNGPDLVKQKTKWIMDNGFGGVWNYDLGTDKLNSSASLANAIYEALTSG